MAAPVPSNRVIPTAKKMGDGWQTLISFASDTDIEFWEQSVQPPGIESEDGPDTSTMHNVRWKTKHQTHLISMTNITVKAAWDPVLYTSILALMGKNDTVTVHFPHGDSLALYARLKSFVPDTMESGKPPMATIVIEPTNQDPNDCSEQGPVYTADTGTGAC